MIDFDVRSNVKEFTRQLNRWEKREVPWATTVSLTRTAQACQEYLQKDVSRTFRVTKKWWLKQQPTGIKVRPATKAQQESAVFSGAYFAELQETGGIKVPMAHKGILTPNESTPKYGRKAGGSRRLMATKRILRKGGRSSGSPIMTMPSGKRGVFRREGKGRLPIQKLYSYTPLAAVPRRWGFRDKAQRVAFASFGEIFARELDKALGYKVANAAVKV